MSLRQERGKGGLRQRRPRDDGVETGWCCYKPRNARNSQKPERTGWTLPRSLRKDPALLTPGSRTSGLQSWRRITFCGFEPPSVWSLMLAAPGTLPRPPSLPSQIMSPAPPQRRPSSERATELFPDVLARRREAGVSLSGI